LLRGQSVRDRNRTLTPALSRRTGRGGKTRHRFDNRADEESPAFGAERLRSQRLRAINHRRAALAAVERPPAVLQGEAVARGAIGGWPPAALAFEFAGDSAPPAGALARQPHVLH